MQFSAIIGQNDIKQRLIQTTSEGRVSHAQMFLGPEGSGSLALAIAYAQYINCSAKTAHDSCGVCSSCIKYEKLIHPDLHFVFPVSTTTKVKKDPVSDYFIEDWRAIVNQHPYFGINQWLEHIGIDNKQGSIQKNESSEILRKLNLKTYEAEYKVMIIWMAEKMNITCANKLLKIIEEPPPKTLFILVVESADAILQTIISRTQLIKIPKLDNESLQARIKQDFELSDDEVADVIHNADGDYNKAIKLLSFDGVSKDYFTYFTTLMRQCFMKNVIDLNKLVNEISTIGREKQKAFLEYSLKMIRENFILNSQNQDIVYLYKDERVFSDKFHPYINQNNIMALTKEFNEAHFHIERNGNPKIIFFDLALKIIILLKK
ncbi:MAG: DNA polymerase III subunit delta [Bacteroidales bacterium]|nr:DNA polymerase III subunit delta [Bacteroidales bacterium]